MLERTALKVYPIIKKVQSRMVKHKGEKESNRQSRSRSKLGGVKESINMKVLLGYLN